MKLSTVIPCLIQSLQSGLLKFCTWKISLNSKEIIKNLYIFYKKTVFAPEICYFSVRSHRGLKVTFNCMTCLIQSLQ